MFKRGFKSWCEKVAIQQRRELKLSPIDPLDAWLLAKHMNIKVWAPDQIPNLDKKYIEILTKKDPGSWSAVTITVGSYDLIIMNSSHTGGRPSSDLMHELAHKLLGHSPESMNITPDRLLMLSSYIRNQEEEANWLSGCLLLPRDAVFNIRRKGWDKSSAAKYYGVSLQMLQFRINVTGVNRQLGYFCKG